MEIREKRQNNQGVSKYKILSNNAGVGSIITTKSGYYVMPKSISHWKFVSDVNTYICDNIGLDDKSLDKNIITEKGVDLVNDPRFISFLKEEISLPKLSRLVAVPHLVLNDWNTPNTKKHPINLRYKEKYAEENHFKDKHFVIPAIHFPRWFKNKKGILKKIEDWKSDWDNEYPRNDNYFAPPRDVKDKVGKRVYKFYNNGNIIEFPMYRPLTQVSMVLICEDGHISDIPWEQYFCAKLDGVDLSNTEGVELFNYNCNPCNSGGKHKLQWLESRNQSESYGIIKCTKCSEIVNLTGIMNIKPFCKGETPWDEVGYAVNCDHRKIMKHALVTSNSIYYANTFSSLFIPKNLVVIELGEKNKISLSEINRIYKNRLNNNPDLEKDTFIDRININEKLEDSGIDIELSDEEITEVKDLFVNGESNEIIYDSYEGYRYQEYRVFSENNNSPEDEKKLIFKDIELPNSLNDYFNKIQEVSTLTISQTQLSFNRVKMGERRRDSDTGEIIRSVGQNIFSEDPDEVYVLPANQTFGEGIFFDLNSGKINEWCNKHEDIFRERYESIQENEISKNLKETMQLEGYGFAKFYLLHTFSHLILRELEFSCGYPTASMKERLYYSDRMCGVLIYTAEGSEGSMGGLVWQAQPQLIETLIKRAMNRSENCSSDPLCWESDGEGNLNLAACFSCSLVPETSCEERNIGLDRQILVNDKFGFFKDMK